MAKLTERKVEAAKDLAMNGDGLYLRVGPNGSKSWILRTLVFGRRRKLGIGSARLFSLAEARELARKYRKAARESDAPASVLAEGCGSLADQKTIQ